MTLTPATSSGLAAQRDTDGTVSLAVGSNVITVEVTAEDDTTEKTYTVTVTRAAASTDATLSGLILSGVDFGTFASDTETYTADVAYSISQTTVTPTLNDSDASYVIKLGGTEDTDGTVSLAVGSNVITVEITAGGRHNREDLHRYRYSRSASLFGRHSEVTEPEWHQHWPVQVSHDFI